MTPDQEAYLILILVAFGAYMLVLGFASISDWLRVEHDDVATKERG